MIRDISSRILTVLIMMLFAACASNEKKPDLPYPAFEETDEIEEQFLAALPGVRARVYDSDMRTRTISGRVDVPLDWKGTTGGDPGKSLEIYVLAGELRFSDFALGPGGYAYVPPGSLGFQLVSDVGAQILYFLDEVNESSVIRSPVILDSDLIDWVEVDEYVYVRSLRSDPGSGANTWLLRIDPGAELEWLSSTAEREGYLVSGVYRHSECLDGAPATWDYRPGGYFRRPANTVNGGPDSVADAQTVWFLREKTSAEQHVEEGCRPY